MTTSFADRLEELIQAAGGATKLSLAAGLSTGYLGTLKTRMRANPDARPDDSALEALARAGGVSYDWLKRGTGERVRSGDSAPSVEPREEPMADAIAAAFDGQRHALADLDAARRVAAETHRHLREGADQRAIAATWLDAAAALRRQGREVTTAAILAHLSELAVKAGRLSEVEAAANAEADASLRAKGMEPGDPAATAALLKNRR